MADHQNPFGRSNRTKRTPPPRQSIPGANVTNSSVILDPTQQSCQLCEQLDNVNMVGCDNCRKWFHFECVGVNQDIADKDWSCLECRLLKIHETPNVKTKPTKGSSKSVHSSSTTRSEARKKKLALDRVEEERKLREARDKAYLDKKYKTLEELGNDSDSDSNTNKDVPGDDLQYTSQWVDKQNELIDLDSNHEMQQGDAQVNNAINVNDPIVPSDLPIINPSANVEPIVETTLYDLNDLFDWQSLSIDVHGTHPATADTNFDSRNPFSVQRPTYQWQNMSLYEPPVSRNEQIKTLSKTVNDHSSLGNDFFDKSRPYQFSPFQWPESVSTSIQQVTRPSYDTNVINTTASKSTTSIVNSTHIQQCPITTNGFQPPSVTSTSTLDYGGAQVEISNTNVVTMQSHITTNIPFLSSSTTVTPAAPQTIVSTLKPQSQGINILPWSAPIQATFANAQQSQVQLPSTSIKQTQNINLTNSVSVAQQFPNVSTTRYTKPSRYQFVMPRLPTESQLFDVSHQSTSQHQSAGPQRTVGPQHFNYSHQDQFTETPQPVRSGTQGFVTFYQRSNPHQSGGFHQSTGPNQSSSLHQSGGFHQSTDPHHSTHPHQSTDPHQSPGLPGGLHQPTYPHQSFGSPRFAGPHQTSDLYQTSDPHQTSDSHQRSGPHQTFSTHQQFGHQPPTSSHQNNDYRQRQPYGPYQVSGPSLSFGHQQFANSPQVNDNQSNYSASAHQSQFPQYGYTPGTVQLEGQTLTPSQIAARPVVHKKLPKFDGNVEKFPTFIRAYEDSTKLCNYSNGENLSRLLESLTGVVYDMFQPQLVYAEAVPGVIKALKDLFGKPEFLIEKLLNKITKEPSPLADDLASIVKFSMSVQNLCGTIKSSNLIDHLNNPTLMKTLVDKLPPSIQLNWALHKQTVANPDLSTFGVWMYELAKIASSISGPPKVKREKNKTEGVVNVQIQNQSKKNHESNSQTERKCPVCSQTSCQKVKDCDKFKRMDVKDRWAIITEKHLCLRCLGPHKYSKCRSNSRCSVANCTRPHHTLLHEDEKNSGKSISKYNCESKDNNVKTSCSHQSLGQRIDIFRIVPVKLFNRGICISTFAYLDDGSNVTTIEKNLANELNLEILAQDTLCIKWSFGKIRRDELVSNQVSVQISGTYHNVPKFDLHNVRTVDDLALPSQTISQEWLDSYKHFKNIPITPYENGKPRLLIGLQYSKLMVSRRTIEGEWSEPIACKTRLGWVVQGPDGDDNLQSQLQPTYSMNVCECSHEDHELHKLVKGFFSLENFGVKISENLVESKELKRARKILEETTKRKNDRYETGLLWRYDDVELPDSYAMALKRLECLERKMKKDSQLAEKMNQQIRDFEQKGYLRKLTLEELKQNHPRTFYLPIFPVFNPKKPEKFRTVWDAAAKVKNVSLNSKLLTGPDDLRPLPDVLRRFREGKVAFTGDIKEMYHQVRIRDADVHAQRFLWRDNDSTRQPDIYIMEVMTFGSTCSPSSAQFVKNKNASEFKDKFPRAVEAIIENHYIDDMLECCDTNEDALRLIHEVKSIHQNAGFEMRNFVSNSTEVLEQLGENVKHQKKNLNVTDELSTERVLGMFWNTADDTFTYSLKFTKVSDDVFNGKRRPTKREVLRAIMSIFDPLGLIANFLVYGKIILQKIWRDSTNWDEPISPATFEYWLKWIKELPKIEKIEIPRWYSPKLYTQNPVSVQLHVFVDASMDASAGVAYFRFEDSEGVDCCLVGAKTKVAPNKPLTIPRLELQGAVLGCRLADSIVKSHRIKISERFFWTDSQTVLSWIKSDARKYQQFVAFRIGEIIENTSTSEWHWIDTKNNVADEGTKWSTTPDFSSSSRWFKGSSFLYQPQSEWNLKLDETHFKTEEELRSIYVLAHLALPSNDVIDPKKFSNWNRLRRAMAYALRFIDNARTQKRNRQLGPLTRNEFIRAQNHLFQLAQRDAFMDEILVIRQNSSLPVGERREISKSSALRTCSPYLDECNILRIRGRIDAAGAVTYHTKRPIFFPEVTT